MNFTFLFNFLLITPDVASPPKFIPKIQEYFEALPAGAWPNFVVGNHDNARIMSKLNNMTSLAQALLSFIHMLPGTVVTYYGDEIAMKDTFIPYDECKDPSCLNNPDDFVKKGRDPERTPMQWDCTNHSGFSQHNSTWLPVAPDYCQVNVLEQEKNLTSVLSLYRRLLAFRKTHPQILVGEITFLLQNCADEDTVVFRTMTNQSAPLFVLVNLGLNATTCHLNGSFPAAINSVQVEFASDQARPGSFPIHDIALASGETLVLKSGGAPTPAPITTDWETIKIALLVGGVFLVVGCLAILFVWKKKRPAEDYDRIREGRP